MKRKPSLPACLRTHRREAVPRPWHGRAMAEDALQVIRKKRIQRTAIPGIRFLFTQSGGTVPTSPCP